MTKSERILCFSPYAFWQLHAMYEIAICHNLQWRGHSFSYVACDGVFSDCDLYWKAVVGPRASQACAGCRSQVKRMLEGCRIPFTWLGRHKTSQDEANARAFVRDLKDAELLDAVFDGHPVASWVKSSVHSHLRANVLDLRDPEHCTAIRSYLYSGALAITCISRMLDAEQPTIMLLFNGRMSYPRIALELAKERGIRVVCHERGVFKETLLLWENETCLSHQPYSELWNQWGGIPLETHEVRKVTQWLVNRAQGANLNWKAFSVQGSLGPLATFLAANRDKRIWGLFTSSTDEIVAQPEHSSAFGNQSRWVEDTVAFVRDRPDVAMVIRVHPNSGGVKSTGRNQDEIRFYQQLRASLPSNVALVMPDDNVSTYALIDRLELGLVYASTVALEIACRGKKVLLAGRTPWMFCDGLELLASAEDYPAVLASRAAKTLSASDAERIATAAYRFAYAYIHRWNIRFPLVKMPDIHNGVLAAAKLEELKPGVHDCLDYCTEVVLGIRPSVPRVTRPVRNGAADEEVPALRNALQILTGRTPEPKNVRVSVVITCYNYGKYLRECVRSVVDQTFEEFEIVIVNDGSTDDSQIVAEACLKEFSGSAITLINQSNSGQPALARNAGIAQAKGEFILPLDADDRIDPAMLRECVDLLDREPAVDIAYTDTLYCHENGQVRFQPSGDFSVKNLREANQLSCCSLYRRKVWSSVGGYRTNVRGYEDWDFWLAAAAAGFAGKRITKVLFFYRAKVSGVYADTVARDRLLRAQMRINNPSCYTEAERAEAGAIIAADIQTPMSAALQDDRMPALRQLVSDLYQAGDLIGCIKACTEALTFAPDDFDLLLVCADAHARTSQLPSAVTILDRLISLQPENEELRQMRASWAAALAPARVGG